ncbi:MAG: class I SAM-dependent methyltransferase [Rhodocyclaceae bacterium]|nr:class I SAM-dependent methyltransferase [Rhodocyclaceae bacterium]
MSDTNQAQIELWNGRVGEKWAAMQVRLDAMLAPATAALQARAGSVANQRVLDIGCGSGVTCTIWLDGGAIVTGVDVSEAMLAVATARTNGKADLIQADASVWRSDAPFDLAVSQFGVMFFADPEAAFVNIAANLRQGGRLVFACWRAVAENYWTAVPMSAIRDLVPPAPPPEPHAPGPFAFADSERLGEILARAGFANVTFNPVDFPVCLASEGGAEAAARFALHVGPAASALAEAGNETRALATQRLTAAFAPHEKNDVVALDGAIWLVEAVRA